MNSLKNMTPAAALIGLALLVTTATHAEIIGKSSCEAKGGHCNPSVTCLTNNFGCETWCNCTGIWDNEKCSKITNANACQATGHCFWHPDRAYSYSCFWKPEGLGSL